MCLREKFVNKALALNCGYSVSELWARKECPDDYVGYVKVDPQGVISSNLNFEKEKRKKLQNLSEIVSSTNNNIIVIVLESPHIDEFKDLDFIHPAIGTTGSNLEKHFKDLIKLLSQNLQNDTTYSVYIMNSIRFQCSLGKKTKLYRTEMFKYLWNVGCDKDFEKRLKYFHPCMILNFCTRTDLLQTNVQKVIDQYTESKTTVVYRGYHPSYWNLEERRVIYRYYQGQNKDIIF